MEAGATGYLLKEAPMEILTAAVFAADRDEMVLAPPVVRCPPYRNWDNHGAPTSR